MIDYLKTDEVGTYVEFDVKKGDKFSISVAPISNNSNKLTIEWKAQYA